MAEIVIPTLLVFLITAVLGFLVVLMWKCGLVDLPDLRKLRRRPRKPRPQPQPQLESNHMPQRNSNSYWQRIAKKWQALADKKERERREWQSKADKAANKGKGRKRR